MHNKTINFFFLNRVKDWTVWYTYTSVKDLVLPKYFKHDTEDNRDVMLTWTLQHEVFSASFHVFSVD